MTLTYAHGVFCPQLTVGPAFVAAVASTGILVDAHLMVEEPRRLLPDIATAGASVITVPAEIAGWGPDVVVSGSAILRCAEPVIPRPAAAPVSGGWPRHRQSTMRIPLLPCRHGYPAQR